jgi:pimeloyl-ACP methyl ester carboxylesterase
VQRPISVNCIQQKVTSPAWNKKPSWFLVAKEDRMILEETQRFMAERMGANICAYDVDHSPMLTAPHFVTNVILNAASETFAK